MANPVQVDKFEGGDVDEFIEHFEICALANGWETEKKALMIATCLKGEALEVYKTVNTEGRKDYGIVKETLQNAFKAEDQRFTALSEFHQRSMFPNETPQRYLFQLKRLLNKAFPEMDDQAKEQLIFEQFIRGLPKAVYENIRISPDIKTCQDALKRAQVLIRMHNEIPESQPELVASVQMKEEAHRVVQARDEGSGTISKDAAIEEAVSMITAQFKSSKIKERDYYTCATRRGFGSRRSYDGKQRKLICYECQGEGHYAEECPSRRKPKIRCYHCGRLGHIMRNCTESAIGQTLNEKGPIGRAEMRSQKY